MSVYVDDMHASPMGRLGRMKMSHMVADSDGELHAMADKIGVARRHFQNTNSGPHYDICYSKRSLAVAAGALEVGLRTMAAMVAVRRISGALPSIAVALSYRRAASARAMTEGGRA